jgi:hypothetical protein
MGRIGKLDEDVVTTGWQELNYDRLTARVDPMPRRVVEGNVEMPDPRDDLEPSAPVNGDDPEVVGAVGNHDESAREGIMKGSADDEPSGGLRSRRSDSRQIEIRLGNRLPEGIRARTIRKYQGG